MAAPDWCSRADGHEDVLHDRLEVLVVIRSELDGVHTAVGICKCNTADLLVIDIESNCRDAVQIHLVQRLVASVSQLLVDVVNSNLHAFIIGDSNVPALRGICSLVNNALLGVLIRDLQNIPVARKIEIKSQSGGNPGSFISIRIHVLVAENDVRCAALRGDLCLRCHRADRADAHHHSCEHDHCKSFLHHL